jgi:E3 ubiquitin-protein ligase RNF115/126
MSTPSDNNNSNLPSNNDNDNSSESNVTPTEQASSNSINSSTPTTGATNQNQIGYCHVCDRQIQIDQDSFTCSVCNGGFIELLETPQPIPQTRRTVTTHRFMNDGNNPISSLLPLLLPQLMGQTGAQQIGTQQINFNPQLNQTGTNANATQGQSGTRLQFIVPNSEPGEQVDLYGIINNVLSDLLRSGSGGSTGSMPQNTQFHFQAPPMRMFQLHSDMRDYAWGAGGLDTIITQLLNQLENTGPPPATEQQLINLPVVKINEEEFEKKVECSICMEDFRLHEEARKLPCKHYFHEPCITEWLKLHGTCPVCRKNLNGEDTSQREYISRPTEQDSNTSESSEASRPSNTQTSGSTDNSDQTNTNTNNTNSNTNQNSEIYYDMDFD